jgi:hypothetical protein
MIVYLLRKIRLAWLWAVAMLIWRNRALIIQTLRSLYDRIRAVQPEQATVHPIVQPVDQSTVQPSGRRLKLAVRARGE